jgi:acetyltransferase-like isoleucine patch superfamily enzyme
MTASRTRSREVVVRTGCDLEADESAILGYLTARRIPVGELVIGDAARIRSNTVIYSNAEIGDRLETGHNVTIREENRIGTDLNIWNNSTIDYGCIIGDRVRIHNNVYVAQYTTIEDDVFLAPGVMIANDPHPICTRCMQGPTIKRGARIGINATILGRITIGEFAMVGAGAVVTRDVPPHSLVVGNPARVVRKLDELRCPLGLVDQPYVNGRDVRLRSRVTASGHVRDEPAQLLEVQT